MPICGVRVHHLSENPHWYAASVRSIRDQAAIPVEMARLREEFDGGSSVVKMCPTATETLGKNGFGPTAPVP
ncbi:hypothetical protein GWI33_006870 [Rhynchophorus ferrugineus]|uniref:Uncharacterized protein n=1 Tax=Rhynchophorus ferrugineus TaxID=354439 RepID=A0A834IF76_RHYFE|nr:hypothetical protein GWI33_006870 [Rhynchophorus ferrugineus]